MADAFFGGLVNTFTAPARMVGIPIPSIGGGGGAPAASPALPVSHPDVTAQESAELQQILIAGFAGIALLLLLRD
jgi:hypothetical protein